MPGTQGPTDEELALALDLWAQGYTDRHAAEVLTEELKRKVPRSTAGRWIRQAREKWRTQLDIQVARERAAEALDIWSGMLMDEVRLGTVTLLQALEQLKWLHRERSKLLGTDARWRAVIAMTDERSIPKPDPELAAEIAATIGRPDYEDAPS
jgi:hypothetical protein